MSSTKELRTRTIAGVAPRPPGTLPETAKETRLYSDVVASRSSSRPASPRGDDVVNNPYGCRPGSRSIFTF
jgi:hypothetical protein